MHDAKRDLGELGFGLNLLSILSALALVVGVLLVSYGLWKMV